MWTIQNEWKIPKMVVNDFLNMSDHLKSVFATILDVLLDLWVMSPTRFRCANSLNSLPFNVQPAQQECPFPYITFLFYLTKMCRKAIWNVMNHGEKNFRSGVTVHLPNETFSKTTANLSWNVSEIPYILLFFGIFTPRIESTKSRYFRSVPPSESDHFWVRTLPFQ